MKTFLIYRQLSQEVVGSLGSSMALLDRSRGLGVEASTGREAEQAAFTPAGLPRTFSGAGLFCIWYCLSESHLPRVSGGDGGVRSCLAL